MLEDVLGMASVADMREEADRDDWQIWAGDKLEQNRMQPGSNRSKQMSVQVFSNIIFWHNFEVHCDTYLDPRLHPW